MKCSYRETPESFEKVHHDEAAQPRIHTDITNDKGRDVSPKRPARLTRSEAQNHKPTQKTQLLPIHRTPLTMRIHDIQRRDNPSKPPTPPDFSEKHPYLAEGGPQENTDHPTFWGSRYHYGK